MTSGYKPLDEEAALKKDEFTRKVMRKKCFDFKIIEGPPYSVTAGVKRLLMEVQWCTFSPFNLQKQFNLHLHHGLNHWTSIYTIQPPPMVYMEVEWCKKFLFEIKKFELDYAPELEEIEPL